MPAARGFWLALLPVLASAESAKLGSFNVYTDTVYLRKGEVHNAWRKPQPLPQDVVQKFAGRTMLVKAVDIDIVRICPITGKETPLPLTEVYNHHHASLFGGMSELEEMYKREQGHDPLGPPGLHVERKLAHRGCMMQGAAINALLEEARAKGHTSIAAFGGASGAEFRGTPTAMPTPYAFALHNITEDYAFMALMHFIDMHGAKEVGERRFECPCTSARHFDLENGTIDGIKPLPFACNEELVKQGNPSCSLATYQGGYRCCEHGVFLTEKIPGKLAKRHALRAKLTVTYYDEELPNRKIVKHVDCCDATGNQTVKGNIEYDVPQCAAGTPPHLCEHIATSIQPLDVSLGHGRVANHSRRDPNQLLDLVHAWGHQHVGALGMELWNEQTGQLLCRTQPRFGTGNESEVGNEGGFLVGIKPCVWGPPPLAPPPRLRAGDMLRTVARYNSSIARHGVMSLWLMEAAEVRADEPDFLV